VLHVLDRVASIVVEEYLVGIQAAVVRKLPRRVRPDTLNLYAYGVIAVSDEAVGLNPTGLYSRLRTT